MADGEALRGGHLIASRRGHRLVELSVVELHGPRAKQEQGSVQEAPVWERLGKTAAARHKDWGQWLTTPLTDKELAAVRRAVVSGRSYGAEGWVLAPRGRCRWT